MKKTFSEIKIGEIGTIEINVPLIKIGSGKPKVLLLCGVHGNEISGLFVVQKLLETLKLKTGGLNIITAANPLAQALDQRETPTDSKDLNRSFPGDPKAEGLTPRLAAAISAEAEKCDLVIDLHTFQDPSPIVAIFMNHGCAEIKQESLRFIKAFDPDIIWQLSTITKEERRLSGSLGPKLAEEGIVNFAVEMPEHFRISERQLDKVVNGLVNALALLDMVDRGKKKAQKDIPIFERRKMNANHAGLFIPQKKLMEKVRKGEKVGEIVSIKNFEKNDVISHASGPLIVVKEKPLVNTGDALFTVGKRIGKL